MFTPSLSQWIPILCPILLLIIIYLISRRSTSPYSKFPLPPGPRGIPFLGNILDFPSPDVPEFTHWLKHKDLYGPISSVKVLNTTLIIIHSPQAAHDLLDSNSGRPEMLFANELCGYGSILISQGYTSTFREQRKLLHRELGTKKVVEGFRDMMELEVKRQLVRSFWEPERWMEHFKKTTAATILKSTYGYTISPHTPDILVDMVSKTLANFSLATVPLGWPVDIFPFLRYLPENFPGVTFQKTAREWKTTFRRGAYTPYRFTQRQVAAKPQDLYPSYVSKLLSSMNAATFQEGITDAIPEANREQHEEDIIWTATTLYGAGSDTTVITLRAFTLAMLLFPSVQAQAQCEIDTLTTTTDNNTNETTIRLPNFAQDRARTPYINALIKELLRWWPIAPLGFPHTTPSESVYEGYRIPKDAVLIPAVWWFLHDPNVYKNPEVFEPERFMSSEEHQNRPEPDPTTHGTFGYGRRMCPGRIFAEESLWINIVCVLATFTIAKVVGENGKELDGGVDVDVKPTPGILGYPPEFSFQVKPRSQRCADLLREVERGMEWEKGDAELLGEETQ